MKPETLVKLSVALLSEAEHEFRYKANACLHEATMAHGANLIQWHISIAEYERLIAKADAVLEAIEKLNKI
jgi:hypothetical protein